MIFSTNISALKAFNSFTSSNTSLQKVFRKISSGLRINSSADDASGLAVSERMRAQINGFAAALRNSQDTISLLQAAGGALERVNDILQSMRELSLQAANDTLTSQDRKHIQQELDELIGQINTIAGTTTFNKRKLLDGTSGALWSASDTSLKVIVKGSISEGNMNSEGDYLIRITANPGKAQVLTSNIIEAAELGISPARRTYNEINIESPDESLSRGGWSFADGTVTINQDGSYHIKGSGTLTNNTIKITQGVEANILLEDVSIDGKSAFYISEGANVYLHLAGRNTLHSGLNHAGLEVDSNASVMIGSYDDVSELNVYGGTNGAGIGGGRNSDNGTVIITGGNVSAISIGGPSEDGYLPGVRHYQAEGAGIGGGAGGSGGAIIIAGGRVRANSGDPKAELGYEGIAAGIGSGFSDPYVHMNGETTKIIITGGDIAAVGGGAGAGIGNGGSAATGSHEGAEVTIYGGKINASGGVWAAGIGGGFANDGGIITIYDGDIEAYSGTKPNDKNAYGAGIGGGEWGKKRNYINTFGTI